MEIKTIIDDKEKFLFSNFLNSFDTIKFTFITQFLDKIIGSAFLDKIPKMILYPIVKYLVYFEFNPISQKKN